MAEEKWVDRTVDDSGDDPSPEAVVFDEPGDDPLAHAFKTEDDHLFVGQSPLQAASSTESEDRKPAARQGVRHSFDEALDTSHFDDTVEHQNKRPRTSHDDAVAILPRHDSIPRIDSVARMSSFDHPGEHIMAVNMSTYQSPTVAHHPNPHAMLNPYANPSPGYAVYLQDNVARAPSSRTTHESSTLR